MAETLADYLGFLRVIHISKVLTGVCRDPEVDMVLGCAFQAHAQCIVSGDKDLLDLEVFRGIGIIRATELLKLLST